MSLDTLKEIQDELIKLGYKTKANEGFLSVDVGQGVVAVVSIDDGQLVISCLLAKLGDLIDENSTENAVSVLLSLLDSNSATRPFAFSIEPGDGESPEDYPLVLEDSVPIGNFCSLELKILMENLNKALGIAHKVICASRTQAH